MELYEHSVTEEIAGLVSRLKELEDERAALLEKQRRLDADIIQHLAARKSKGESDADVRRDLRRFARDTLKLSKSVAASRSSAAVVAKSSPEVVSYVRRGRISFSAIRAMEPYRELEGLLEASIGKTRRQVEQLVASLSDGNSSVIELIDSRPPKERGRRKTQKGKRGRRAKLKRTKGKRTKKRQPKAKRPRRTAR